VSHANAALTPRARLRLARLIVEEGWPVALAARRYDVSWPTAKRWAARYAAVGADGMADRSRACLMDYFSQIRMLARTMPAR